MLLIAAFALIALGLACGAALVLAPFGLLPGAAGPALWLLFPVLLSGGYLLFVAPASLPQIRAMSRLASGALLLLALVAAAGLVLDAIGMAVSVSSTTSLWYVLLIGLALGPLGMLAHRAGPAQV